MRERRVATDAAHQQLLPIISIISRLSGASKIKQFNVRHWWCLGGASTVVFFTHGVAPFAQPNKYTNCFFVLGKFLAFEKFFNVKSKKFALNQKARQRPRQRQRLSLSLLRPLFLTRIALGHSITIDSGVKKFNFFLANQFAVRACNEEMANAVAVAVADGLMAGQTDGQTDMETDRHSGHMENATHALPRLNNWLATLTWPT